MGPSRGVGSGLPRPAPSPIPACVKLECLQRTGSFKIRGAANRLLTLPSHVRSSGVVACSSGNHGRAVAHVAKELGIPATICVPEWTDPSKMEAIERAGARLVRSGATYDEAEEEALRLASETGRTLVHPFDDSAVIEGQGTLGWEILETCPDVAEVWLPLSGGGLAAGVAAALADKGVRVVAVSAENAAVMHASLEAGRPISVPEQPTLATALSGGIGLENRYTFDLVRELIHDFLVVSEREIADAVARAAMEMKVVVEGGGAVALAAWWSGLRRPSGPVVIVASGGNLDPQTLVRIVDGEPAAYR